MQHLPPSGVWFVNCNSSVPDQVLRFLPVHILTQLWSCPPSQTGGPSPPRCPSRSPWQTLGSQTSTGLQTARRTVRTATRPMAPPTGRTDTTAVQPHILEPQVRTWRVCHRVTSARACKYTLLGPQLWVEVICGQTGTFNTPKGHLNGFSWFTLQWGQTDLVLKKFQCGLLEFPQNPGFVYLETSSLVRPSEVRAKSCRHMGLGSIHTPCEHYCVLPPIHVLSSCCLSLSLFPFAVDDSANLPPSPPPSPSAEQTGPMAPGTPTHTPDHSRRWVQECEWL